MKSYSNTYIFVFSAVMVIIVAALLSFVSIQLKPLQQKNIEIEKKHDILKSVGSALDADEQDNKKAYIEQVYDQFISESIVIDSEGNKKSGLEAFNIDMKIEVKKDPEQRNLPIYIYSSNGEKKYIIPVRGKGLWGPIWGYVALNDDYNTIAGTIFDHKGETPGLGAEINTEKFQLQFNGKQIFEGNTLTSINVVKGGADPANIHAVDAISGGTITSNGLQDMLYDCLISYEKYFNSKRN